MYVLFLLNNYYTKLPIMKVSGLTKQNIVILFIHLLYLLYLLYVSQFILLNI
jgi:hypothetical protein